MHPILTSPWEGLEASKKREGGKGLYLPGQTAISNDQGNKRHPTLKPGDEGIRATETQLVGSEGSGEHLLGLRRSGHRGRRK